MGYVAYVAVLVLCYASGTSRSHFPLHVAFAIRTNSTCMLYLPFARARCIRILHL